MKCRDCGAVILYYECGCGSKCHLDPRTGKKHWDTCLGNDLKANSGGTIKELCLMCEEDKIRGLNKRIYQLIEIRQKVCRLTKKKHSHKYYIFAKKSN